VGVGVGVGVGVDVGVGVGALAILFYFGGKWVGKMVCVIVHIYSSFILKI